MTTMSKMDVPPMAAALLSGLAAESALFGKGRGTHDRIFFQW